MPRVRVAHLGMSRRYYWVLKRPTGSAQPWGVGMYDDPMLLALQSLPQRHSRRCVSFYATIFAERLHDSRASYHC